MTRLKLLDLDRGVEVEVEIEPWRHPSTVVEKLRELGVVKHDETITLGVSTGGRQIYYVPAATVEQLAAYLAQSRQKLCFRRFSIHRYQP